MPTFNKHRRLIRSIQFKRVFQKPLKSSDSCFVVLARPNQQDQQIARLGLAIAKKQLRRSVDRNRIKRIVREHFRLKVSNECGLDFVVMARSSAKDYSNEKLSYFLERHFQRLISRQSNSLT